MLMAWIVDGGGRSKIGFLVFNRSPQPAYEYACHEGNHSMPGILAGARKNEELGKVNYADEGE